MRHATRSSAIIARRFAVAGSIGLAVWLGALAPATAQVNPGQECDNVPLCQVQPRGSFLLAGWGTVDFDYTCLGDYPYAWRFSYSQTGYPRSAPSPRYLPSHRARLGSCSRTGICFRPTA